VAFLRYYVSVCMEGLKRTTQNFNRDRTLSKIRTGHIQNTRQSHFKLPQPVPCSVKDLAGGGRDLLFSEVYTFPVLAESV